MVSKGLDTRKISRRCQANQKVQAQYTLDITEGDVYQLVDTLFGYGCHLNLGKAIKTFTRHCLLNGRCWLRQSIDFGMKRNSLDLPRKSRIKACLRAHQDPGFDPHNQTITIDRIERFKYAELGRFKIGHVDFANIPVPQLGLCWIGPTER
ncbi:hypothetical protein VNO77_08194 [Canavalia gladiata]|uniref:Uncharacterized protein n=1 Tax=Canavalia gladiata TaxID=3824 RepID=A0AAN9QTP7_CANGL